MDLQQERRALLLKLASLIAKRDEALAQANRTERLTAVLIAETEDRLARIEDLLRCQSALAA